MKSKSCLWKLSNRLTDLKSRESHDIVLDHKNLVQALILCFDILIKFKKSRKGAEGIEFIVAVMIIACTRIQRLMSLKCKSLIQFRLRWSEIASYGQLGPQMGIMRT